MTLKMTDAVRTALLEIDTGGVRVIKVGDYGSTRIHGASHPPTITRVTKAGLAHREGDAWALTDAGKTALAEAMVL